MKLDPRRAKNTTTKLTQSSKAEENSFNPEKLSFSTPKPKKEETQ